MASSHLVMVSSVTCLSLALRLCSLGVMPFMADPQYVCWSMVLGSDVDLGKTL